MHWPVERSTRTEYCLQHNCTRCVASVLRRSFIAQPRRRECGDSSVECCRPPPSPAPPASYFLPIALMCFFVPFCPVLSSLGGDSLSAMLCSRSHSAPLAVTASVVRDSPPRAFSFKILSRRRGPEDVQHLHSTLPHRPTDRPTEGGGRRFFSLQYASPCLLFSLVSRIVPPESQVLQETRASSPSSSSSGYSFFARALQLRPRRRRGCPPGWLPLPGCSFSL